MKKVIITGVTGFIGYHLLRELREKGVEVLALCRPDNKDIDQIKKLDHVHVAACGLEQIRQLPELCAEREFDAFYHWRGKERRGVQGEVTGHSWTMSGGPVIAWKRHGKCGAGK